ncbi:dTMP kinase [Candidatus Curtissbacteria bacterium RBG_13_35_7]|uniref:Thymidylate kinase n=1 Tax=Candidatus Curtissbacteria bacterium RBG_13_35_7 TaxID=1797705 RepID=A0A1F5G4Q4_9BACT|nr:MAG: dTMP kinase [Candidatus Curtissbacteria bacterium RBG_13_35_7]
MFTKKGKLIVFEGADGSGKATQAKLLSKYLKGKNINCAFISFPNYSSTWGKLIKRYLKGEFGDVNQVDPYLASILYAGDRLIASKKIKNWLKKGKVIVCDRYIGSNLAHQVVKLQTPNSKLQYIRWLEDFEYRQNNIPKENLVILLSVPTETSQKLMQSRKLDIHEKNIGYLKQVSGIFEKLAKEKKNWVKVECVKNNILLKSEVIHKKILSVLKSKRLI